MDAINASKLRIRVVNKIIKLSNCDPSKSFTVCQMYGSYFHAWSVYFQTTNNKMIFQIINVMTNALCSQKQQLDDLIRQLVNADFSDSTLDIFFTDFVSFDV